MRDTAETVLEGPAMASTPAEMRALAPRFRGATAAADIARGVREGATTGPALAGQGGDGAMTRNEAIFAALSLALAALAGMLVEESALNLVLGALIAGFAVGRNRARKAEGRGLGRYFGEVLAFGLVAGLAATAGANLSGTA